MEFSEKSELLNGFPTRVHVSTNDMLSPDNPVFVTATQQKGVSSWELPLLVQTQSGAVLFTTMARTLCPHDAGPDIKTENRPMIHISTSNRSNVTVDIKLRRVADFYVDVNKKVELSVTPSTPKYYFFSFDQHPWNISHPEAGIGPKFNYTIPKSVILMVDSDTDVCATVSIQNNSCPVFDNEKEVLYKGYHLTMMSKGGITLTQSMFPSGFYIVFIVNENDEACTGSSAQRQLWDDNRAKNFTFVVVATVSYREYVVGALVTLALVALVALLVLLALVACTCRCTETVTIIEEEPIAQASTSGESAPSRGGALSGGAHSDGAHSGGAHSDGEADDEQWSRSHPLTVHKLTRAPPETFTRRSDRYFWGALTVGVVYALPVVQLLFTYQRMVFQTGDQDLCYYNFLCAHPLGFLSDFNHVYSNVGYVLLGAVFLGQVRYRQLKSRGMPQDMGIPQHYGLLYSMGLGLVMEGLLSACYHLCPNKMNFQFDSSFMYVIAVLVMIKLYQNRHSDIIPSAHTTFMIIAVIMTLGLFGILFPSVAFSILFTILHMLTCFVLTLKIYYAGSFKMEWGAAGRGVSAVRAGGLRALRPAHRARAALLALANIANWAFAIYSAYEHNKDFARQLLAILMGNAILYTLFYVAMKLVHRERLAPHTWLYAVLAHVAWFAALRLFLDSKTKWSQTPAQSRQHNAACSSLQLFDSHDAWHVASAAAMFLSFNMLLTVDDPAANTPRHVLHTF
ncbi:SID1 transmembrane family member 1-like isoform X2 [Trichoplusia ni]|nr:SID1 transmembrane family member 1-like isoform X2 [Trichoplusia ni]